MSLTVNMKTNHYWWLSLTLCLCDFFFKKDIHIHLLSTRCLTVCAHFHSSHSHHSLATRLISPDMTCVIKPHHSDFYHYGLHLECSYSDSVKRKITCQVCGGRSGLFLHSGETPWMSGNVTIQRPLCQALLILLYMNAAEWVTVGMPHLSLTCAGFPGCPSAALDPSYLWK